MFSLSPALVSPVDVAIDYARFSSTLAIAGFFFLLRFAVIDIGFHILG